MRGGGVDLLAPQPGGGARVGQRQLLAVRALCAVGHEKRMGGLEPLFQHAARQNAAAHDAQLRGVQRLAARRRQQQPLPRPGQRAGSQRREIGFGKIEPLRRGFRHLGRLALRRGGRVGVGCLLQLRHKVALAAVGGPDAAGVSGAEIRVVGGAIGLARAAKAAAGQVAERERGVLCEESRDLSLVLRRGKCAGRVDEHASRSQQRRRVFENFGPQLRTVRH